MRIMIKSHKGDFHQQGWYIRENDTGFWVCLEPNSDVEFKFPWTLFSFDKLEEK
jgi:hypothetical protein